MDRKPATKRSKSTPAASQRSPGRPPGDADRRALALDAALDCYVRRGIAATSLRDIAEGAGVTPALLHYYFRDAAGLREAVIAERLLPVFFEVRDSLLGSPDTPLRELLTVFVDALCGMARRHAWLAPMWIREVVSEGGSLRQLLVQDLAPQIAQVLAARFESEQAAGRLNRALDPRLLMVSVLGLTLFPAAGTPIWRQIFDSAELGVDHIREHALALLLRGLELQE